MLEQGLDGVMIGRAAYHDPGEILLPADRLIFGSDTQDRSPEAVVAAIDEEIAKVARGEVGAEELSRTKTKMVSTTMMLK